MNHQKSAGLSLGNQMNSMLSTTASFVLKGTGIAVIAVGISFLLNYLQFPMNVILGIVVGASFALVGAWLADKNTGMAKDLAEVLGIAGGVLITLSILSAVFG